MANTFSIQPLGGEPVFSIAPYSTRMVAAYQDRTGRYHLFTDVIDHHRAGPFRELDSWDAVIKYYASNDLHRFTDHGVVIDKGRWTGDVATSEADCVGAASPGVAVAGDRVLLFYAGRGPANPAGPFTPEMYDLPGRIMLSTAPIDHDGAPSGPFIKHGPVTDYGEPWRSIRHDDPCAVVTDEEVLLFYKGIGPGQKFGNRVVALARTPLEAPTGPYTTHPTPVLKAPGGGETPRAFRVGKTYHMLYLRYRAASQKAGRLYGHYTATDPTRWTLINDTAYESTSPQPGHGAADMCPIWTPFASGASSLALGARLDDGRFGDAGRLKQWLFEIKSARVSAGAS